MLRVCAFVLTWLQSGSGITFDGAIPIWGVAAFVLSIIGSVLTVAITFNTRLGVLATRFKAHEELDAQHRADVKTDMASINENLNYLVRHSQQKPETPVGVLAERIAELILSRKKDGSD